MSVLGTGAFSQRLYAQHNAYSATLNFGIWIRKIPYIVTIAGSRNGTHVARRPLLGKFWQSRIPGNKIRRLIPRPRSSTDCIKLSETNDYVHSSQEKNYDPSGNEDDKLIRFCCGNCRDHLQEVIPFHPKYTHYVYVRKFTECIGR
jgi:hypothetical protein